ncbi:hypothetical protein BCR44DRAFT_1399553 [Catenaria anguillulae PL171]|uniref:Fatty acid hydroxylase domain-containing protein n=1 Tax=Catenaria anguillulae PL171 TaxID=765915 RepID=A0A1Y2I0R7_9FUNG|nr:hypothetical protein BCR44DRAFT_1399553 [Catenaria anguillulae PL171]
MRATWAAWVTSMGVGGFMTYGLFVWTTALYYTHAGILGLLDVSLRYPQSALGRWAKAHKIQDAKLVTGADWFKCLKVVVRNQLTINIPWVCCTSASCTPGRLRACSGGDANVLDVEGKGTTWAATMPSAAQVGKEFLVCALVEELLFYSSHRLFHWGPLYKRFHKIHHEFTAPIGLAATYAHPLEHTLSNLTPVLLGPALFGMHPLSAFVWITLAITTTIHTHSGYELYGWPTARKHDWHHYAFIYQFGVSGVVDKWLGTDGGERYRRYVHRYDERVRMVREGKGTPEEADRADDEDEKLK